MGKALIENVNLMYQNNSAAHYYRGLLTVLKAELVRRGLEILEHPKPRKPKTGVRIIR